MIILYIITFYNMYSLIYLSVTDALSCGTKSKVSSQNRERLSESETKRKNESNTAIARMLPQQDKLS